MLKLAGTVASRLRIDGWSNALTGLGVSGKDKRLGMNYQWVRFSETELEHLYATDAAARRVVEYVPDEGTREWIELRLNSDSANKDSVKLMNEEMERLCVQHKFNQAWSWARLYGGAGILMVVDDGKELSEPLDLMSIREVKSLTVLNRFELLTSKLITNLEDPNFGLQELYDLAPRSSSDDLLYGTTVHHTRIIRFDGMPLPRRLFEINDSWSDSVLPKMLNALRNYNSAHDSIASALQDFRLMVLKLKDLSGMVASDSDTELMARLQLLNMSKSILNSVAIDAQDEDIKNLDTNFTNIEKVIEKVEARLVADSDLPHTVVLGEGAQGTLGGGGQSEDRNAKGFVGAQQELKLTRPINRIMEVIQSAKAGPFKGKVVEELTWDFKPLWQMSEKEKAEIHKVQAEADNIYWSMGAVSEETIAKSRFGGSEYSTETQMEEMASNEVKKSEVPPEQSAIDHDETVYDHAHSLFIDRVGFGYTSGANGDGENHTHTMPNGVETGPAIALFGGGHMHQIDHETYTSPAFPLGVAKEAQAVMEEAKSEEPAMVEVELDIKSGKLTIKTNSQDAAKRELQTIILSKENFSSMAKAKETAKRFGDFIEGKEEETGENYRFRVKDPGEFMENSFRSFKPRGIKGVTLVFGALK